MRFTFYSILAFLVAIAFLLIIGLYESQFWQYACETIFVWSLADVIYNKLKISDYSHLYYFVFIILVVGATGFATWAFNIAMNWAYNLTVTQANATPSAFPSASGHWTNGWVLFHLLFSVFVAFLALYDSQL